LKIAFFVQYSHAAGTYFRWHNLAIGLKQLGNEIDVYAGDHNWNAPLRNEVKDGINYYITPSLLSARFFGGGNDPLTGFRRLLHLPKKEYDVYHLFQPYIQAYIPWRYLKVRKTKAVFLYDWDDLWTGGLFSAKPNGPIEWFMHKNVARLEKKIPAQAHGVTVCSQFLADKLEGEVVKQVLYNGFWSKPPVDKKSLREKWKLRDSIFYLAYVGRTAQEMSWIAQALDSLVNHGFDKVQLIVCGPPKQVLEDLKMLDKKQVIYLGELSTIESFEICAGSDLGLVPLENSNFNKSRFPIKFFDFLSVGTPVYLSDVGEVAKIGAAIGGVFIGSNEKQQWTDHLYEIITAIQKHDFKIDITQIEGKYGWTTVVKNLATLYSEILTKKT
jgi:glycosyltransferase involved in cell wall biosynthesis